MAIPVKTDYPSFLKLGYDIGSGPTELSCACLIKRLKCRCNVTFYNVNNSGMISLGCNPPRQ